MKRVYVNEEWCPDCHCFDPMCIKSYIADDATDGDLYEENSEVWYNGIRCKRA